MLVASHPGNRNRELHGAYSARHELDARAAEVAEALLEAAPHTIPPARSGRSPPVASTFQTFQESVSSSRRGMAGIPTLVTPPD